jgi:hypothetical protein
LLHRRKPCEGNVFMLGKILRIGFKRQHVFFNKGARTLPQFLDFRRKCKIHIVSPSSISPSSISPRRSALRKLAIVIKAATIAAQDLARNK